MAQPRHLQPAPGPGRGHPGRPGRFGRLLAVSLLTAVFATTFASFARPAGVSASTATDMEARLLSSINAERAKRGLVAIRLDSRLVDYAGDRASTMASSGVMKHPSCLSCSLTNRGIQYYSNGEAIAYTTWPWGSQAADSIFTGWMKSDLHRALLMSSKFNYIGLGVAYRSSAHQTFAAAVLTESKDRTKPWAKMGSGRRSGSTVSWSWSGGDTRLQTHTAGFKNFDVQYRVGSGTWSTIRSAVTSTSLSLSSRRGGHYYGLRVRSRDNRGYVSSWSGEVRVWVP
jgi:uncharacterized protein YkwD